MPFGKSSLNLKDYKQRTVSFVVFLPVIVFCIHVPLFAQNNQGNGENSIKNLTPELTLSQAQLDFNRGEYGDAFRRVRKAAGELGPAHPSVAYLMGSLYEATGRYETALKEYQKVLDDRASLLNQAHFGETLYRVAAIHRSRGETEEYLDILQRLSMEDTDYREAGRGTQWERLFTMLLDEAPRTGGDLDKVLLFYRVSSSQSLRAHLELADYYYHQTEKLDRAYRHSLFAFLALYSRGLERLEEIFPEYRFLPKQGGISRYFRIIHRSESGEFPDEDAAADEIENYFRFRDPVPELLEYHRKSELFEASYLLAVILRTMSNSESQPQVIRNRLERESERLFRFVGRYAADISGKERIAENAEIQLEQPFPATQAAWF